MIPTLLYLLQVALLAGGGDAPWNATSPADEATAAKALAPLLTRFDDAKADREKLRDEILAFRRAHPGTQAAQRAALLLLKLPSPLDQLAPADKATGLPKEVVAVLAGHSRAVAALAVAPDGLTVASSSWDASLRLWKLGGAAGKEWARLPGSPSGLAFAPDGKTLAGGRTDSQLALWVLTGKEPRERQTLAGHTHRPFALAFIPNGKMLVTGCFGPVLRFWDLRGAEPDGWALQSTGEKGPGFTVASLAVSADGRLLATASHAGATALRLWEIQGALLKERTVPAVKARLLAFAPDGPTLAVHLEGGAIELWDAGKDKPQLRLKLAGHAAPKPGAAVAALAFAPDGKALASAGKDQAVIVWDTASGKRLHEWTLPAEITALVYAPDGRHLLAGGADGAIYVLRLGKG
jgi:WD40 repeat protein